MDEIVNQLSDIINIINNIIEDNKKKAKAIGEHIQNLFKEMAYDKHCIRLCAKVYLAMTSMF